MTNRGDGVMAVPSDSALHCRENIERQPKAKRLMSFLERRQVNLDTSRVQRIDMLDVE